jgi:hypothetical protein
MSIHVVEYTKCEGIPHNNVAFLSTTCDESVFARVNEGVHTLLVKIERFVLLVSQLFNVVNMNESIERG